MVLTVGLDRARERRRVAGDGDRRWRRAAFVGVVDAAVSRPSGLHGDPRGRSAKPVKGQRGPEVTGDDELGRRRGSPAWRSRRRSLRAEARWRLGLCGALVDGGIRGVRGMLKGRWWRSLACEPRKLRRGDCAAESGLNPHPIPGGFLERKGAGEASVWVRARVRDRAGPCASPGWSGATGSGKTELAERAERNRGAARRGRRG